MHDYQRRLLPTTAQKGIIKSRCLNQLQHTSWPDRHFRRLSICRIDSFSFESKPEHSNTLRFSTNHRIRFFSFKLKVTSLELDSLVRRFLCQLSALLYRLVLGAEDMGYLRNVRSFIFLPENTGKKSDGSNDYGKGNIRLLCFFLFHNSIPVF